MVAYNAKRITLNGYLDTGSKGSSGVLEGLQKVENYCEKLDISMVKINDLELVGTTLKFKKKT